MAAGFHFARREKRERRGKEGGRKENRDRWMDMEMSPRWFPVIRAGQLETRGWRVRGHRT